MMKILAALLLIPALSFAAPSYLAEKKFPGETEVESTAELAKLFNEELAREGSSLRKSLADVLKEYADQSGPQIVSVEAGDLWRTSSGGSGGLYGSEYLLPVKVAYKSMTETVAYIRATDHLSFRDDGGLTIRLVKRVKVIIK